TRLMPDCPHQFQIDAFGGFDHYPTGRDFVILGLPLAVKLRERRQWIERSTVSGVVAGASLAAFDCRVSHRHLASPHGPMVCQPPRVFSTCKPWALRPPADGQSGAPFLGAIGVSRSLTQWSLV